MVVPLFLGDYTKGLPLFFIHKREKKKKESDNWDVPMQLGLSKSSLKLGRNVYRCSHKRVYYNPILAITKWPWKTLCWHLVWGNFEHHKVYLDLRVGLVLVSEMT